MKHLKRGRKFSRTRDVRRSLLRNLMFQLVMEERIATTEAKAKELAVVVAKMVTRAKGGSLADRRVLASRLPEAAAKKLMDVLAPRFLERKGGYTRIIKMTPRKSDAARRAIIQFTS